jgi:DNA-binding transcriptional ArsR family regulator
MTTDRLSSTFAALADPTRRAILARLALGETSVTELARPFEMSMPAISKHLRVLEHAGLVARGREAQWRPCRIEAKPLQEVAGWVEHYRKFWEESFDRLDDYLQVLQQTELKKREKKHGRKQSKR